VPFKNVNAEPVSGTVLVAVPAGSSRSATRAHAGQSLKGLTFVPLQEARQVPTGSFFDTTRGTVQIVTAQTQANATQTGQFFAGIFQMLQRRSQRGIADARLAGGSFGSCARVGKANAARRRLSRKTIRRLSANVKGRYRTSGKYASATVRGTAWTMTDRCDGTLTKVTRGVVVVRDLARQRNIVVRAGKSRLVRAP
jgi:hypothetical protein